MRVGMLGHRTLHLGRLSTLSGSEADQSFARSHALMARDLGDAGCTALYSIRRGPSELQRAGRGGVMALADLVSRKWIRHFHRPARPGL